ncbi:hypothetical protein M1349_02180 [Patescibacteria group bacterium]|nr:hypothetical protein [Patescibacteria group bacterium]
MDALSSDELRLSQETRHTIQSPEEAESTLQRTFEGYFRPEFVGSEIERVKQKFPGKFDRISGFVMPERKNPFMDPQAAEEWVKAQMEMQEEFQKAEKEWEEKWAGMKPTEINSVMALTTATNKQSVLTKLAGEYGLNVRFEKSETDQMDQLTEDEIKRKLDFPGRSPDWYPWAIARNKIVPYPLSLTPFPTPRFSFDTTVWQGDKLLEKPKSLDEFNEAVNAISGQELTTVVASNFSLITHSGEPIFWPGGAAIQANMKKLTEAEIKQYVEMQTTGDKYKKTNGGLDFSTPEGIVLIDDKAPVRVLPLGYGYVPYGFAEFDLSKYPESEVIQLAKTALPALKTTFQGVPEHLMRDVFKNIKSVYKQF